MAALAGVCAYVVCNQNEQRLGLVSRLRSLGAQIAPRLGREVSHVVFSRIAVPTPEQKTKEDIELRTLFDRARKVRLGGATRARKCGAPSTSTAAALHPAHQRPLNVLPPPSSSCTGRLSCHLCDAAMGAELCGSGAAGNGECAATCNCRLLCRCFTVVDFSAGVLYRQL